MILPVPAYSLTWTFDFDPDTGTGVPGAPQYAFGINVAAHSFWWKQGVGPTDWIKIGSGSGGVVLGVNVLQDGTDIGGNPHGTLNFFGGGVDASDAGAGVANVEIPLGALVQSQGVPLSAAPIPTLDFTGPGVSAALAGSTAVVTVPGSSTSAFTYTVTGAEPDLSEIVVALPAARPDANYSVFPQTQGSTNIVACDVHGRTTTQFVLSTTGNLTAGDVIGFLVVENS